MLRPLLNHGTQRLPNDDDDDDDDDYDDQYIYTSVITSSVSPSNIQ